MSSNRLDRILTWTEWLFESGVRLCSPLYIITAICLILTVAYVFFCIFLIEITPLEGSVVLLGHKAIAAWLLLNTLFNYYMCVVTNPGSTLDIAQSSLYNGYAQHNWRFCKTCDLPKPDLAHHCSICKKCVLRMDHHCPWIGNCVGYRNYRYFYLFLFYISIGCCYAFLMMNYYRHIFLNRKEHTFLPTFCYILCAAIGIAVGNLLLWHTFLIATGQGTIDCLDNFKKWKDAFKEGRKWRNPYSQGFINNFKSVFDVDGNFWWFLWTMPNITPKKGTGLFSITHQLDNYP